MQRPPARRLRITFLAVCASLLAMTVGPRAVEAATRTQVHHSAAAYAKAKGFHVGIAVYDTKRHTLHGSGAYTGYFASESVVKTMIATRLLISGQMRGTTERMAYKMITQSDDYMASALYGRVGGDSLINWVKQYFKVPDLGYPPSRSGWWGNTHIRPSGLVKFYAKVKWNNRVGPWLIRAMRHTTKYGSDGVYQHFGIPSATSGWAVKQGWGADFDDWSSACFNSTGFVNNDRYAVAILARGPGSSYGSGIAGLLTAVAKRLLPGGRYPLPLPRITGMSRQAGATDGGQTITVRGTDLSGVRAVRLGTRDVASFTSVSPTRLTVVTPPRPPGMKHLHVYTSHGATRASSRTAFMVGPRPVVSGVAPAAGGTAGGTRVTVRGTDFVDVTRVSFDGVAGTNLVAESPTRVTVTAPPHAAGPVDVQVWTGFGRSGRVAADRFTYQAAPAVTGLNPHSGAQAGGYQVLISGTSFNGVTTVKFGTASAAFQLLGPTTIRAIAPPGAAGAVPVRVTGTWGTSATGPASTFTYV